MLELVYLWVEGYKSIQKQGFNFSPRFNCKYDDVTNELTIDENDDYIPDFFGENINVTAIVGKNGSGKSSVFEILSQILNGNLKYIYIVNDGAENLLYSKEVTLNSCLKNYGTGGLKSHFSMFYLNISHLERDGIIQNDAISIYDNINYLGVYEKNNFMQTSSASISPSFSVFNLSKFNFLLTEKIVSLFKMHLYSKLIYSHLNITKPSYLRLDYDAQELNDKFKALRKDQLLNGELDNDIHKLEVLLEKLNSNNILDINGSDFTFFFNLADRIFSEIPFKLVFLDSDLEPIVFSGGEKTILFYLERLAYLLQQSQKSESIILLFDEIELYLHPNWQKKIFQIILDIINCGYKKFHILFTSHSPFLLSDIPKQNIIFLNKDKNGNCLVVDGLKEKKQTFGANIHTLLSDSFFMEDGLMGEFAKGKINEIINFHKEAEKEDMNLEQLQKEYKYKRDKFYQIQSTVGEEYLKQILDNHLMEIDKILLGKERAKESKKERLRAELARLDDD